VSTRLGVDVQPIGEVETSLRLFGARYLQGVYDEEERRYARAHPRDAAAYLAERFAAREAVLKLLEAPDAPATWHDIVLSGTRYSPEVRLRGKALEMATTSGISQVFVSLSMCRGDVTAVAVADVTPLTKERGDTR
jgi:holo-[acyl-carrier protein] synthase